MVTPSEIVDFWFGDLDDLERNPAPRFQRWFGKDPDFDRAIGERFEATLMIAAGDDELCAKWCATPLGWLAYILLFDQFPRNIYRGTSEAFAYDLLALKAARKGIAEHWDRQLHPIQRIFVYLPLEHAEDIAMQEHSVELFQKLLDEAPPHLAMIFDSPLDYAKRHMEIIDRFGHFPHRNMILDRTSSPEEIEFLKQPGSSF